MPRIIIEYNMPEGTNRDEIADFVIEAIETWGGQRHPDDPLFYSLRGNINKVVINQKNYNYLLTKD